MRTTSSTRLLAIASLASAQIAHPWGGPILANAMCQNAAAGTLKCLSSVSFTICNGQYSSEMFVAAGTQCQQTLTGDQIIAGAIADADIRIFTAPAAVVTPSPTTSASS